MTELGFVSPFPDLPACNSVDIWDATGRPVLQVLADGSRRAALAERLKQRAIAEEKSSKFSRDFFMGLPDGPKVVHTAGGWLVGVGPGNWLMFGNNEFEAAAFAADLAGAASVVDQTSAYGQLVIGGDGARDLLSRGAFIDFDRLSFRPGDAAVTLVAHIGAVIWSVHEDEFEIAIPTSYCRDFIQWLEATTAALDGEHP